MTLNYAKTASDAALMDAIGLPMLRKWEASRTGRLTMREFRAELQKLVDDLPDTPYWDRTRHRASTAHGSYGIQQVFESWARSRD